MEEDDCDSNNYYLWFPWKKIKAKKFVIFCLGDILLAVYLLKHKTTFHHMATLNGPGESFKTSIRQIFTMWEQITERVDILYALFWIDNFHVVPELNSRWLHVPCLWKDWCFPAVTVGDGLEK